MWGRTDKCQPLDSEQVVRDGQSADIRQCLRGKHLKLKNTQLLLVPSLLAATGEKDGASKTTLAGKQDMSVPTVSGNEGTQKGQRLWLQDGGAGLVKQAEMELEACLVLQLHLSSCTSYSY